MPLTARRGLKPGRKVQFKHNRNLHSLTQSLPHPASDSTHSTQAQMSRLEELEGEELFEDYTLPAYLAASAPDLFHDEKSTLTSHAQQQTERDCLLLLTNPRSLGLPLNSHGIPHLARERHTAFLHNTLRTLPAPYAAADATRPWMFYWALAGLGFLDQDVSEYKGRLIETLRPLQNPSGGFGGGHGQLSHCACSYAAVLALACVDGLDMIDRRAMWEWLGSVKQADGGFRMAVGAEEDIRGAYCAITVITILNLPLALPPKAPARQAGLELFTDGLGEWVGSCQTYEGGIAGAPNNEAHGAYAFCALACLSIIDAPHRSIPQYLDLPALIDCLAKLQTHAEGGFAGRTNKLVDACYSHWVGGCWSLLDAARSNDFPSDIWNRGAANRYLLCCCQSPTKRGGMRDKPSAQADGYHTCYSLSGLSAAQNRWTFHHTDSSLDSTQQTMIDENSGRLTAAFKWSASRPTHQEMQEWRLDEADIVAFVHPVFVIPMEAVRRAEKQFASGRFG